MPQHKIKLYLSHILESTNLIQEYVGEIKNFNFFNNKKMLKSAVEREFTVIGEATNRILKVDPNFKLNNTRQIIGLRNKVVHAYDNISYELLWSIIINDLPKLKKEVEEFLQK
jgi:uncharacterized protein with HEPN domain